MCKLVVEILPAHPWICYFIIKNKGAPRGGGGEGCRAAAPQTTQNWKLKNTHFVDIMVSKVLHDFTFCQNQSLKLTDD
jgi:hypothetical protein